MEHAERVPQQSYLTKLRHLLTTHFDMEELRTLCIDLGEDFDNLRGEGKEAKFGELIARLGRDDRIPDLAQIAQQRRPKVSWIKEWHPPQDISTEKPTIEFVNRAYELDLICKPGAPRFTLLDGPAGYGKTYLLRKARESYEAHKSWKAALVDLKSDPRIVSTDCAVAWPCIANTITQQFAPSQGLRPTIPVGAGEPLIANTLVPFLAGQGANVLLLFDGIEALPSDTSAFLKRLVCDIDYGLQKGGLELHAVFAGRYVGNWGQGAPYALTVLPLSPFDRAAVWDMVEQVVHAEKARKPIPSFLEDLVWWVLYVSGGHPRGIRDVLEVISAAGFIFSDLEFAFLHMPFQRNGRQGTLFELCIEPIIDELLQSVEPPLCRLLKAISPIRRFDQDLLVTILDQEAIAVPRHQSGWELIRALLKTHLISPPTAGDPMFSDQIVRRMLAVQMQIEDSARWRQTNERALEIFHDWALGAGSVDAQVRRSAIVESLYHTLQLIPQGSSPQAVQDRLVQRWNEYLARIDNARDVMQLRDALSQDQELNDLIDRRTSGSAVRALPDSIERYLSEL